MRSSPKLSPKVPAARVLTRSKALGWNLTELPAQLRVMTIDAFCRELALQQPLLSELGCGLDIFAQPNELYRRAARRTLAQIDSAEPELQAAIELLLLWRDNSWQEVETLLVRMLEQRDRWFQAFVLERQPEWGAVRERLERPFARAVRDKMLNWLRCLIGFRGPGSRRWNWRASACEQTAGLCTLSWPSWRIFPWCLSRTWRNSKRRGRRAAAWRSCC